MRFMVMVKATKDSEAGKMPSDRIPLEGPIILRFVRAPVMSTLFCRRRPRKVLIDSLGMPPMSEGRPMSAGHDRFN
jgi:hypothetical protein